MPTRIGKSRSVPAPCMRARRLHHSQSLGRGHRRNSSPAMGFEALATTSLGLANTLGSQPSASMPLSRTAVMIADATDLPVNANLENCGATIRKPRRRRLRARPSGLRRRLDRGFDRQPANPIYDFSLAVKRVPGGRRGPPRTPLPVHADGAGGEFPARPQGSRRHHQRAAGVRGRWRGRTVFPRPAWTSARSAPWCHR